MLWKYLLKLSVDTNFYPLCYGCFMILYSAGIRPRWPLTSQRKDLVFKAVKIKKIKKNGTFFSENFQVSWEVGQGNVEDYARRIQPHKGAVGEGSTEKLVSRVKCKIIRIWIGKVEEHSMKGEKKVSVQIRKHAWLRNWKIGMVKTYSEYMGKTCEKRARELGRSHVIKTDHEKLFGFNF